LYNVQFSNKARRYFNKLKDKKLKEKFKILIYDEIAIDPVIIGEKKKGKIENFYATGFNYKGCTYRVAYEVIETSIILILLVGAHENFYEKLERVY